MSFSNFNTTSQGNPLNKAINNGVGLVFATRDPTNLDKNYTRGQEWQNTVSGQFFKCVSPKSTGAVWIPLTGSGSGSVVSVSDSSNNKAFPDSTGNIQISGGNNITTSITPGSHLETINLTGTTNHALQVGNASNSLTSLPVMDDGFIAIGKTGADPVIARIQEGANVSIGYGPGTIIINAASTVGLNPATAFYAYLSAPTSIAPGVTGDGTSFVIPYNRVAYNVNNGFSTIGNRFVSPFTGIYTFTAAVDLINLGPTHTDYQLILLVNGTTSYLMSEANTAVIRPGTNTVTLNASIQIQMAVNDYAQVQITIGPGGQPKVVGINGGSPTGTGYFTGVSTQPDIEDISWQRITTNVAMLPDSGYFCIAPGGNLQLTLPATSLLGDVIEVNLNGATSWQIKQGAGQQIFIANGSTTLGATGTLTSTAQGDSVRMICSVANLTWNVISFIGNLVTA